MEKLENVKINGSQLERLLSLDRSVDDKDVSNILEILNESLYRYDDHNTPYFRINHLGLKASILAFNQYGDIYAYGMSEYRYYDMIDVKTGAEYPDDDCILFISPTNTCTLRIHLDVEDLYVICTEYSKMLTILFGQNVPFDRDIPYNALRAFLACNIPLFGNHNGKIHLNGVFSLCRDRVIEIGPLTLID